MGKVFLLLFLQKKKTLAFLPNRPLPGALSWRIPDPWLPPPTRASPPHQQRGTAADDEHPPRSRTLSDDTPEGDPTDAPAPGWRVRILDLSGGAEEGITEEVPGFADLEHANAFARAYVRDSVERCRSPGLSPREVMEVWLQFGEDALVVDAGEDGWQSATEIAGFAEHRARRPDRDWRALDPRTGGDTDDDDAPDAEDTP